MTTQTITGPTAVGESPRLLTPSEVARAFNVTPTTVTRWANTGRLTSIRILGGQRRFRQDEVLAVLHGTT